VHGFEWTLLDQMILERQNLSVKIKENSEMDLSKQTLFSFSTQKVSLKHFLSKIKMFLFKG